MIKTLKNFEIINIVDSIGELMQTKLPVKVGWSISKNMRTLESSYKTYLEHEAKLVNEYALKSGSEIVYDDKKQPKFAPENLKKYIKEREELLNCEDTFDFIVVKLSHIENLDIKPSTLYNLEFMIDDTV